MSQNIKQRITKDLIKSLQPQGTLYRVYDTTINGFVLRVQPSGTKTFFLEYRNALGSNQSFKIGRLGQITLAQAREVAEKKSGEVATGVDIQARKKKDRLEAKAEEFNTLSGFLEKKYEPWAIAELRSGRQTLKRIRTNFPHLLPRKLLEIDAWELSKWRAENISNGKKATTINRDISCLYSALSKAVEWGAITSHPLEKFKPIKTDFNGSIRYLTIEEEGRLLLALDKREQVLREKRISANKWRQERKVELYPEIKQEDFADHLKPMVLLTLYTGLRRGEIFNLRWEDINFSIATLTVHGAKAKNLTTRHIPLNPHAKQILTQWQKQQKGDSGHVFHNKKGYRFDNIDSSWDSVLAMAKIDNFRWHDLRHHFASKLVMAGVPLNTVRELLGHSDIKMTLRYAHLAPDHKAEAVSKLTLAGVFP